jgi:intracellular multiplication protein IcmG
MANDSVNSEEEYHFTETDAADALEASNPPVKKSPGLNKTIGSRVVLVLGIVIVILAMYKLAGVLFSSKKAPIKPPAITTQTPLPPQALVQTGVTPGALAKVSERVDKIENAVPQIMTALSELQDKVNDLNNTLQSLSNTLTQQQAQLTALEQKPAPKPLPPEKVVHRSPVAHGQTYYVQAMVPGRAWLKSKHGGTTTVKVGDTLTGYGTIEMIDTGQGRVLTSSGRAINYNPKDS